MNPKSDTLQPDVSPFFEPDSCTFSYVVKDPTSSSCAIIDSVLDFDYPSGTISYQSADKIIQHIQEKKLSVELIIETHVHADHLSAAPYLQEKLGGKIMISKKITEIQEVFGTMFNAGSDFQRDGSQFDILLEDNQKYSIGNLNCIALHTPGHTPACMTHLIGDAAFIGDTLFMPDGGTARADFPGGDARVLYKSIQRLLNLPDETKMFMCHDYQPNGRELEYVCTVEEQKLSNIHVRTGVTENEFTVLRETRDETLGLPRLILPSLQVNMTAGHFPEPEDNHTTYLKVPISGLKNNT